MEVPDLAELISLFEDAPTTEYDDLDWPVGRHTFRLTRGRITVRFALDPLAGEVAVTLFADEQEVAHLGRIRTVDRLTITRDRSGGEGLRLWAPAVSSRPLVLRTRPAISLAWDIRDTGQW
ncbi:hypothetical protein [Nocardia mikamii]|uniref:hypothetical protein n=1 Tax=Nocardia mikamii TaxID=508464 RepID=UPI0007A5586B|nr:hypothetical protein [Nocardia mikamii]